MIKSFYVIPIFNTNLIYNDWFPFMKKLFNTSGEQYKKLRIKDKLGTMTETEAVELLSVNGRLIKRPIAVDGNRITVGFDEIEYKKIWS